MLAAILPCTSTPAFAIRRDQIPDDIRRRLPEFLLTIIDPRALAALSLADLEEFADAYDDGELRFVNECRIESASGPLSEEQAMGVLQCMPGAPYIESRFMRQATWAYGKGIFGALSWEIYENADGSVDVHLRYSSRDPSFISPELSYDSTGGVLYGAAWQDLYHNGKDQQLSYGAQFNTEDAAEPRIFGSWSDGTLNGGRNSLGLSGSVANNWRSRRGGHPDAARFREREARLDGSYSWNRSLKLGGKRFTKTLRAGVYDLHSFVLRGDPAAGNAPREEVPLAGDGAYIGASISSSQRDQLFTPKSGYSYSLGASQHLGDFNYRELSLDLRQYKPARNVLGQQARSSIPFGETVDVRELLPSASLAWQAQATLQDGEVPFAHELAAGGTPGVRGYSSSRSVGTKLLAARAEYRLNLDSQGANQAFVFSDHALVGETLDKLEALDSVGAGGLFTLPLYGGVKLGAWYGRALNGEDYSYGVAFGYQF